MDKCTRHTRPLCISEAWTLDTVTTFKFLVLLPPCYIEEGKLEMMLCGNVKKINVFMNVRLCYH